MKKLALIIVASASLVGTAMACPNSEHDGKTAEKSEKPAPKATDKDQPKETAKKDAPAAKPAPSPSDTANKVSSK